MPGSASVEIYIYPPPLKDWISKLDDFLKLSERELLHNAGSVSNGQAMKKAEEEFKKYTRDNDKKYISDFDRVAKKLAREDKRAKR